VLRPKTVEEVSKVLAHCNNRKLAVIPQGGRTSLVAGATATFDEIVINVERMNKIYELPPYTGILKLQAGVILEDAEHYCNEQGFVFPLDLGAKGSCQIGGNLGANAGGLHFLKYGSLHGNTIGLRAVLADGRILDTLNSHRKDNTGYDLKQLFIGAEGTLGIITDASILCYPLPKSTSLCFLSVASFKEVKEILVKVSSNIRF
jgi:D-lactate dehydrogenase (cytochrome)